LGDSRCVEKLMPYKSFVKQKNDILESFFIFADFIIFAMVFCGKEGFYE